MCHLQLLKLNKEYDSYYKSGCVELEETVK